MQTGPTRVLVWATTLQADILALASYLDRDDGFEVMVVAPEVDAFRSEPFFGVRPLRCPVLDRADPQVRPAVERFGAEVVVAENHLPPFPAAPRLCTSWHGLGWKARGRSDLKTFYRGTRRLTGEDPRKPSKRFMAQCYGEPDRLFRIEHWKLDPDTCRVIGMAFSDLLLDPPYTREDLAGHYAIDVLGRKTVLLSLTWHYGRFLSGNRDGAGLRSGKAGLEADLAFVEHLLRSVGQQGANVLFCLHDRHRYEASYLAALLERASRLDHVQVKFKSDHPDNLADLVVADVMVSNLSSFVTCFYYSGRPSVHVVPVPDDAHGVRLSQVKRGKVKYRKLRSDEPLWMNEPDDNGGLTARTLQETAEAIGRALREPDCCAERSRAWIANHVHLPDGRTAMRFGAELKRFCGERS